MTNPGELWADKIYIVLPLGYPNLAHMHTFLLHSRCMGQLIHNVLTCEHYVVHCVVLES